jgi:branched-chain amino acid transport system permease protein
MFSGNSGIMSFGHLSFMAIGAYTSALLTIPPGTKEVLLPDLPRAVREIEIGVWPASLIAGGVAAATAAVIAVPLMRMAGLLAAMATFAVLQISWVVASNWDDVTRGTGAMLGVPMTTTLGSALLWAVVAVVLAWSYQISGAGMRLRASREDEAAARALGINVGNERRLAFVLSAFVMAMGGAQFGHFFGTFNPDNFYITLTFLLFAMLVVGGMKTLTGAVLGTLVVSTVGEGLLRGERALGLAGARELAFALLMLGALILRPSGLTGEREPGFGWARAGVALVGRVASMPRRRESARTDLNGIVESREDEHERDSAVRS